MKYFELDPDEEKLIKVYRMLARRTLDKTRNINIRVSEKTLAKLRARAVEDGLPYQTLAASVLHRFANEGG